MVLSLADAEIQLVVQHEDVERRMATKLGVVAANSGALVEGAVILKARVVEAMETSLSEGDEDVERDLAAQRESLHALCAPIIEILCRIYKPAANGGHGGESFRGGRGRGAGFGSPA